MVPVDLPAANAAGAGSPPRVLLYARPGTPGSPARVSASLRLAFALAAPGRLRIVGGPGAELAASRTLRPAPHILPTAARGALPLLPALLELGRTAGGETPCILVPDDLRSSWEEELRHRLPAALDAVAAAPRAAVVIGLADAGEATADRARLVPAPDGPAPGPLAALLDPSPVAGERQPAGRAFLRDSGVVVGRVSSLLALYKDHLPGAFLALVQAWLAGDAERALATLPEARLDRDLLARAARRLQIVGPG